MAHFLPPLAGLSARLRRWRGGAPAAGGIPSVAEISHELRSPVAAMTGFADLLLASKLTEQQRGHAELIAESGRMLLGLIESLHAAPAPTAEAGCDPGEVLHFSVRLLEPLATAKGLHLGLWIDPAVPERAGIDSQSLRQALLNLLGNAIKFTEQGGVDVEARVENSCEGRRLVIAVIDSGIGIAPDQIGRIFHPFAQADSTISARFGGSGLGLAIAQRLVDECGGRLSAHSQHGVGSNFSLSLPLPETAPIAAPSISPLAPPPGNALAGQRVLIAEDDGISRRLLLALTASLGLDVECVGCGDAVRDAVVAAKAAGRPFAAVLMDLNMPGSGGIAATRRLRRAGHGLPIIALSAAARAEDIAACHKAGMQAHLAKPVTALALARELARCLPAAPVPLEDRYQDRKSQLLAGLRSALERDPGAVDWDAIAGELHRIAGVAAHFGEAGLGDTARRLEQRIRQAADAGRRQAELRKAWPLFAQVA